MDVSGEVQRQFEPAYRQPEWVATAIKYDNRTVAIEGFRSFGQTENPVLSAAFVGDAVPLNAAAALFRAGYEDVLQALGTAPAKEEGLR